MNKIKLFIIFIMIVFIVSVETVSIATIKGKVNTETVRVRKEATTDSSIVKLVSIGDKIKITGESGNWYKVEVEDVIGYVRKDLLDLDEKYTSNNENQNEEPNNSTDEPSENGNSNQGETGTGNENSSTGENNSQGEDSEISNPDENVSNNQGENTGNDADVGNENTENLGQNQEKTMGEDKTISTITLNEQEKEIGAKKNLSSDVNLKILPLVNSNNIISLTVDTEVTIVEIINSWCRVETAEGESGWIRIDQ